MKTIKVRCLANDQVISISGEDPQAPEGFEEVHEVVEEAPASKTAKTAKQPAE